MGFLKCLHLRPARGYKNYEFVVDWQLDGKRKRKFFLTSDEAHHFFHQLRRDHIQERAVDVPLTRSELAAVRKARRMGLNLRDLVNAAAESHLPTA